MRRDPLTLALWANPGLVRSFALVLAGSWLVAASAQVSVPMYPVPMTLQTLAISLIGLTYGARLAGVTLVAYLLQGAAGLPFFAGGHGGLPYMFGPTGGFLLGFVAMAFATGWLVERGLDRGFWRLFVAALVPALLLFVPGVAWLWAITPLSLETAIMAGAVPFQLGGLVKSAIAALIVVGGWKALEARRR
ncbi:MAG: biotin transporter BioY [Rhodobacteraceae bacterium]|nr:biotin transporter BioY [Paracoccaceae bacterium]